MKMFRKINQLGAALLLSVVQPAVQAQYACITNNDRTITIKGYGGVGGEVAIPAMIYGLPVTGVGGGFADNTNLTGIILPDSITSIGGAAFSGCTALRSVTIGKGITSLWFGPCCAYEWQFYGCVSLTNFTVDPDNPAFFSQDGVLYNKDHDLLLAYPQGRRGSFAIPDTVHSIARAFDNCTGLTSISIGSNYSPRFSGCTSLTNISVDPLNPDFSSRGGVLFNKAGDMLVYYPEGRLGPTILPRANQVAGYAFDVAGTAGTAIVVAATTNLRLGSWVPVQTNMLDNGLASFVDSQWTNYPTRFYRILQP